MSDLNKWIADGVRIHYDPTPGGVPNEHGGKSFSLRVPVLEVTEWVADRQKVAVQIAEALNDDDQKDAEIARLREALKPFAKAGEIKLCGEWRDDERFGQTDVSFHLTFGDLRRASKAIGGAA